VPRPVGRSWNTGAVAGTPVYDSLVAEFRSALRAIPGDQGSDPYFAPVVPVRGVWTGTSVLEERPRPRAKHRAALQNVYESV
jgi:hypothetical protein